MKGMGKKKQLKRKNGEIKEVTDGKEIEVRNERNAIGYCKWKMKGGSIE